MSTEFATVNHSNQFEFNFGPIASPATGADAANGVRLRHTIRTVSMVISLHRSFVQIVLPMLRLRRRMHATVKATWENSKPYLNSNRVYGFRTARNVHFVHPFSFSI